MYNLLKEEATHNFLEPNYEGLTVALTLFPHIAIKLPVTPIAGEIDAVYAGTRWPPYRWHRDPMRDLRNHDSHCSVFCHQWLFVRIVL